MQLLNGTLYTNGVASLLYVLMGICPIMFVRDGAPEASAQICKHLQSGIKVDVSSKMAWNESMSYLTVESLTVLQDNLTRVDYQFTGL